ncbi:uncharacterized aarF domain-containing protein kinase 1 isoform X1 [Amborella trichopoda]|uniref:uncharacterized aarF domain-containing protein kinase 1 isoform X1 n=2 Tax=Amborella trichopoda TaxID=13333 RepID=UPI0009BF6371|nr:uncharacterized aarF domain-containing protein kinase 1 isoform X1 [Amborella trichopoda]|eukprot:XP_011625354.2 uncharacterized aarF domain-containing protein kinase 1 isoform X1 [Amborella trichopoda]
MRRLLWGRNIGSKAKACGYLMAAASTAAVAIHIYSDDDFNNKLRTFYHGIVRSSRAVSTCTLNVIDYKYTLRMLAPNSEEYYEALSQVHHRAANRILKLCEVNKGFYVKAGQFIASIRQVPKEYQSLLSSLQDQAVPFQFDAIKEVITRNFGRELSEIFLSFDEQPIAAASIAQVHHAILKDYQEVAVKVQYPGLEKQMQIDAKTMYILSKSIAWIFPEYQFEWIVPEFEKTISMELDFTQEAKNSERTARNFKRKNVVRVPKIFWDLTTKQVLTMQFWHGYKIDDLEKLKEVGIKPQKVAQALAEVFAEMIFVHGFVHGDPHPGNILVSPRGGQAFYLVLLDHGIYREFDDEFRLNFCQLWKALILQDSRKIQDLGEKLGAGKYSKFFPIIFTGRTIDSKSALGRSMSDEEKKKLKQELRSFDLGDISSFMESLPRDFLTILRTDGLVRSIISKLGVSQRVRLLAYAKFAVAGLKTEPNLETFGDMSSRVWTSIEYTSLRILLEFLELHSRMDAFRLLFINKLKAVVSEISRFLWSVPSLVIKMQPLKTLFNN